MARIVTGSANCRDLVALAGGCRALPEVLQQLEGVNATLLLQLARHWTPSRICASALTAPSWTTRRFPCGRAA